MASMCPRQYIARAGQAWRAARRSLVILLDLRHRTQGCPPTACQLTQEMQAPIQSVQPCRLCLPKTFQVAWNGSDVCPSEWGSVFSRKARQEQWRADAADPIREGPVAKRAIEQVFRLRGHHPGSLSSRNTGGSGLSWMTGTRSQSRYGGASAVVFHHTSHCTDSDGKDTTGIPNTGPIGALFGMLL